MAYYKADEDYQNRIIIRNPLSTKEFRILMSEDEVERRLSEKEDPVLLSIEKWERFYKMFQVVSKKNDPEYFYGDLIGYIGYRTCALCLSSIKKYELQYGTQEYKEDRCTMCPYKQIDWCLDGSSSFKQIEYFINGYIPDDINEKLNIDFKFLSTSERKNLIDSAILKMIESLKKLLP